MASSPAEIKKHIKLYWLIGLFLCIFTITTLLVGELDFGAPGLDGPDVVLGLAIAVAKSSLVALIFMHLSNERGLIYKVLLFTTAFAISLAGLTMFAHLDPIPPNSHVTDKVKYAPGPTLEMSGPKKAATPHE